MKKQYKDNVNEHHRITKFLNSLKINHVFHVSLMKPSNASTILRIVLEPPSLIEINDEQKYKME
jgi:hypothetical protein